MHLSHKKTIKILTILLVGSGLLTACNQAGNSSYSANTPQQIVANNSEIPQKMLRIVNHTGSAIDHMSIVSRSGKVIFKSSTGLDCINNQDCNADINGLTTSKDMIAKFYNNKNQLISMSLLNDNPKQFAYITVYANSTIFGASLFKELVVFDKSNTASVLEKLTTMFKNSNMWNNDIFTTLGNYYTQQLKNGTTASEEHFYQNLSNDFAKHVTISNQIPQAYMPLLKAPMLGCDPGIGDSVFNFIIPFGTMGGELTEGLATLGKTLFDTVCTADSFDFAGAFAEIDEKLANIQSSLDALGTDVAALRNLVTIQNEDRINVSMQALYENEISYNQEYTNFLWENDVNSMSEFTALFGGIDNLDRNIWGSMIFDASEGIIGSIAKQNSNISLLTSQPVIKQLTDQLQAKCGDYTKITDAKGNPADLLAATDLCNAQTIHTGMYLTALSQQAKLRMLDITQVINTSKIPSQFKNNFGTKIKWADVPNVINNNTESRLNDTFAFMQNNVFTPRRDLADMNIQLSEQQNCIVIPSKFEKTKVFPNIIQWKNENYDSITVGISCNGKALTPRPLLPGGIYHIDASQNKIIMDNARDWEVNENINPFISSNAATLSPSTRGSIMILSSGITIGFPRNSYYANTGDLNWMKDRMRDMGRDEFATSMSWGGWINYGTIELKTDFSTKLYLPVSIIWEGYKGWTLWAAKDYGVRADRYGSSSKGNDSIVSYGPNYKNVYEDANPYINVGGYRWFRSYSSTPYNESRYSVLDMRDNY